MLGPSGCGKTTVLNLIAGFEAPDAGTVRIDGADVAARPPHRREVGMVFQDYALFPHLTVRENVAFPLRVRGTSEPEVTGRVGAMLELVRLSGYGDRLPRQLSGGQQQRVALARALVFRPRVLLMDEPFGALDRALRETMRAELRELQRALGITVVLVTHDQDEAMDLSDRVAVMRAGRLQQVAPPRELYESPANAFVAGFVGESNLLEAVVVSVEGERAVVRTAGGRRIQAARGSARVGDRVLVLLRPGAAALAEAGGAPDEGLVGVVEDVADPGPDRARPRPPRRRRARHGDPASSGRRARASARRCGSPSSWPPDGGSAARSGVLRRRRGLCRGWLRAHRRCGVAARPGAAATVVAVRPRDLLLGVALVTLGACATASAPAKARDLTPAERDGLSQVLEPLLTAAGLWRELRRRVRRSLQRARWRTPSASP